MSRKRRTTRRRRTTAHRRRRRNPPPKSIRNWNTYGGGTFSPGKHSYESIQPEGRYYVDPVASAYGRHLGYRVKFANDKGKLTGGLWRLLDMVRSPQAGAKVALAHWNKNFSGTVTNPRRRRKAQRRRR